ncbi:MAG: LON peptidase substrate-binding domain-containing protein, partial [Alphaproteobacteria bacterium]
MRDLIPSINKGHLLKKNLKKYIIIPLRETVLFPGMVTPIFIGRKKSVKSAEKAMEENLPILFVTQKNPQIEQVGISDLYAIGTTIEVLQYLKLPTGTLKVLSEAVGTAHVYSYYEKDGVIYGEAEPLEHRANEPLASLEKNIASLTGLFSLYARLSRRIPSDVVKVLKKVHDLGGVYDIILGHLDVSLAEQQRILSLPSTEKRLDKFAEILQNRITTIKLDQRIQNRVKTSMDKNQKDFYLNEKIKAIQKELGEDTDDLNVFKEKLKKASLP